MPRARMPPETETNVLYKSGRRCCICHGLYHDLTTKQGQIAHLDQDPSNAAEENLVFLCLPHHDAYDSRTRQSKNFTISEVKLYRSKLYDEVRLLREVEEKDPVASVEFVTTDGAIALANSYHVSSVTDLGVGDYVIGLALKQSSDNYALTPLGKTPRNFEILKMNADGFRIKFEGPEPPYVGFRIGR